MNNFDRQIKNFPDVDQARISTLNTIENIHKEFCALVLSRIVERINEGGTDAYIGNEDYRLSPNHFVLIDFEQKMKEKGYGVEIELKGSTGFSYVKSVTIDWKTKENIDE